MMAKDPVSASLCLLSSIQVRDANERPLWKTQKSHVSYNFDVRSRSLSSRDLRNSSQTNREVTLVPSKSPTSPSRLQKAVLDDRKSAFRMRKKVWHRHDAAEIWKVDAAWKKERFVCVDLSDCNFFFCEKDFMFFHFSYRSRWGLSNARTPSF